MSPDFFECAEDERFLPLIEAEAHEILPGLWLGGEANAMDVVWLKVHSISRILSINSYAISPLETSCDMSESLKSWFTLNVEHEYIEALDSPTQLARALSACECAPKKRVHLLETSRVSTLWV